MDRGPIRYARSGDVNIAYQVIGEGPFDLVLIHGFFSHLELDWEHPALAHIIERLVLVRAADPVRQARHRPLRPVRRHARLRGADGRRSRRDGRGRSEQAALFGYSEGGPMSRALRRDVPGANACARPLRHVRETPANGRRLSLGADVGGARRERPKSSSEHWGERFDLEAMAPNAADDLIEWAGSEAGPR